MWIFFPPTHKAQLARQPGQSSAPASAWMAAAACGGLQLMGQFRPAQLRVLVRLPPLDAATTAGGARQKTTRRRPDLAGKLRGEGSEFGRTSLPPLLVGPPLLQPPGPGTRSLLPSLPHGTLSIVDSLHFTEVATSTYPSRLVAAVLLPCLARGEWGSILT
jgi:hypothetical protein